MAGYFSHFSFGLGWYIDPLLVRVREEVFREFLSAFHPDAQARILDIGVSADDHISSNHFEKRYAHTGQVCALGIDLLPGLSQQFPGLEVVQGDGRALPFADNSFDFVYSHAVIEHVGSRARQLLFLKEALRVARKGVLFTTPNRWHPLESHTGLPLLHYLPPAVYRRVYRALGKNMYASEETLNLLSSRQILRLIDGLGAPVRERSLRRVRWLGLASNFVAVIRKA